jgi:hypothetical protein
VFRGSSHITRLVTEAAISTGNTMSVDLIQLFRITTKRKKQFAKYGIIEQRRTTTHINEEKDDEQPI